MRRITISLPDDLAAGLAREASRARVPVSHVARVAIESHLGRARGDRRLIRFAALARSGQHDTARRFEEVLRREWGD